MRAVGRDSIKATASLRNQRSQVSCGRIIHISHTSKLPWISRALRFICLTQQSHLRNVFLKDYESARRLNIRPFTQRDSMRRIAIWSSTEDRMRETIPDLGWWSQESLVKRMNGIGGSG